MIEEEFDDYAPGQFPGDSDLAGSYGKIYFEVFSDGRVEASIFYRWAGSEKRRRDFEGSFARYGDVVATEAVEYSVVV